MAGPGSWESVDFGTLDDGEKGTDGHIATSTAPAARENLQETERERREEASDKVDAPEMREEDVSDAVAVLPEASAEEWLEFHPGDLEAEVRTSTSGSDSRGSSERWSSSTRGSTSVLELEKLENDLFDHDDVARSSADLRKLAALGAKEVEEGEEGSPQLTQQRRRRFLAAEELLKTEREYSSYLNVLVEVYLEPLLEMCQRKRSGSMATAARLLRVSSAGVGSGGDVELTMERVGKVFCIQELGLLRSLSEELFLALAKKMRDWSPQQTVGDVFLKLGDFLKLYAQYCGNYEAAIEEYGRLADCCSAFRDFVDAADKDVRSLNHRLKNYLIMPVQRPPRYALLLAALLKYTPPEHPDYELLSGALEKMQAILNHVNRSVSTEEARQKVVEIQARLKKLRLVEPHRLYVYDGHLVSLNCSPSKLHCYLFNDILVTARTVRMLGQEYEEVQRRIPLKTAWVVSDASGDARLLGRYNGQCAFLLLSPQICYVLQCPSDEAREHWTAAIATSIEELLLGNPGNLEMRRQYRPQWRYGSWRVVKRNDLTLRGTLETTRKATVFRISSADEVAAGQGEGAGGRGATAAEGGGKKLKKKFNQLAERFSRMPATDSSRRQISHRPSGSAAAPPSGALYSPLGAPPPLPPRSQPDTGPLALTEERPRDLSPGSGMNPKPRPSPALQAPL